jgi:hypothetical protein
MGRLRRLGAANTAAVQTLVSDTAVQYGVDPALALAVANQESGFNQNAVSSAGAIGVMQLMPSTAAGLGVDPTNLNQNVSGGVGLLASLLDRYNGNTALALAAYNAGPGPVATYGGVPPYPETQNYVASIMARFPASSASTPSVTSTVSYPADDESAASLDLSMGSGIDTSDDGSSSIFPQWVWWLGGGAVALALFNR